MSTIRSVLIAAAGAALAAGCLVASSVSAATYVVCNRWDTCWTVRDHYTFYPPDVRVIWHDEAWREAHEKDSRYRWVTPENDRGWYDEKGDWHPYVTPAP